MEDPSGPLAQRESLPCGGVAKLFKFLVLYDDLETFTHTHKYTQPVLYSNSVPSKRSIFPRSTGSVIVLIVRYI